VVSDLEHFDRNFNSHPLTDTSHSDCLCLASLNIALVKSLLVFVFSVETTPARAPSLSTNSPPESLSPIWSLLDVISASISTSAVCQIRKICSEKWPNFLNWPSFLNWRHDHFTSCVESLSLQFKVLAIWCFSAYRTLQRISAPIHGQHQIPPPYDQQLKYLKEKLLNQNNGK